MFTARERDVRISSQLLICCCTNPELLGKGEKGIGRQSRSHSMRISHHVAPTDSWHPWRRMQGCCDLVEIVDLVLSCVARTHMPAPCAVAAIVTLLTAAKHDSSHGQASGQVSKHDSSRGRGALQQAASCNSGMAHDTSVTSCDAFCSASSKSTHCRLCRCAQCSFCAVTAASVGTLSSKKSSKTADGGHQHHA